MAYILEVTGLSNHPSGMGRKAYVEELNVSSDSVTVKFMVKYFIDGEELISNSLSSNVQRFSTDNETYQELLSIQANGGATIYQNLLGLINAQVTKLIEDGKTD